MLQRVAAGDDLHDADNSTRRSACALRDRGLVDISRRDGWNATLTSTGAFYVEHGHHPDRPSDGNRPATPRPLRNAAQKRPSVKRQSSGFDLTGQQLIDLLHENAGTVTVTNPDAVMRAAWRRAIHAAKEDGLVPPGHHLRHHGRDTGDLQIELIEGEHPDARHWTPRQQMEVSDVLDQPHPILAKLQRRPGGLYVTAASRGRALCILHALLVEWERRGHKAELGEDEAGITMVIAESRYILQMSEERELVEQLRTAQELDQKKTYSWQRVQPTRREVGTGRLVLELSHDLAIQRPSSTLG